MFWSAIHFRFFSLPSAFLWSLLPLRVVGLCMVFPVNLLRILCSFSPFSAPAHPIPPSLPDVTIVNVNQVQHPMLLLRTSPSPPPFFSFPLLPSPHPLRLLTCRSPHYTPVFVQMESIFVGNTAILLRVIQFPSQLPGFSSLQSVLIALSHP